VPQECQRQGAAVELTRTYSPRLLGRFPPLAPHHISSPLAIKGGPSLVGIFSAGRRHLRSQLVCNGFVAYFRESLMIRGITTAHENYAYSTAVFSSESFCQLVGFSIRLGLYKEIT
jgi:hypothetical protein